MQIQSVALHWIAIPFLEPFRIANGEVSVKESIIVELTTADGVTGFGESSAMTGGFYSDETPESAWNHLEHTLIPFALSCPELSPVQLSDSLRQISGDPFARAGLEGAVWDTYTRKSGLPLLKFLGGRDKSVPSGAAIGLCDSRSDLISRVDFFIRRGYHRIKIKIKPGWDIEPVHAIREKFGNIPLMVDANASYSIHDHFSIFHVLDCCGLMMIEQPLAKDEFEASAELQRNLRTPICADESAYSYEALETIITKKCARIINVKIQRVGGLWIAKGMAERAVQAGLHCWVGTMPELGVASMQGLHLATHPAFTLPTDIDRATDGIPMTLFIL